MINFRADIDGFGAVVKALEKMSGKDFEYVVKAEVAKIFQGAIKELPVGTAKKIAQRTMPEGKKLRSYVGRRKVTVLPFKPSRRFHAGELRQTGVGPRGGKKFDRPIKAWISSPIPAGAGLGAFEAFVETQKRKTLERIANIGTTAGIIYYMGKRGGIPMPKVKGEAKIKKGRARSNVWKKVSGISKGEKRAYTFTAETDGLKMTSVHGIGREISVATNKRTKFFMRSVTDNFQKNLKKYAPKKYPLIFS